MTDDEHRAQREALFHHIEKHLGDTVSGLIGEGFEDVSISDFFHILGRVHSHLAGVAISAAAVRADLPLAARMHMAEGAAAHLIRVAALERPVDPQPDVTPAPEAPQPQPGGRFDFNSWL